MIFNFTLKNVGVKLITVVLLLVLSNALFAQEEEVQPENNFNTLFGEQITYGGYGALSMGYSQIADYNAFTFGVQGAWVIGHGVAIGFAGRAFITETAIDIVSYDDWASIGGGYGGFFIEPIFFGKQPIHFTTPVIIGMGAVSYGGRTEYEHYDYNENNEWDEFFIVEPGIEVELNITRFFRLAAGVSYRFASDVKLVARDFMGGEQIVLSDSDMNSLNFKLAFKFGKF